MEQIDKDDYLVSTILGDDETQGSDSHRNSAGSSSDLSQFSVFTSNGMVRVDEESEEHKMIKIFLILGMGSEANVVAVHKNVCSEGSTSQARLERFRSFSKAVARKHGGNANIVPAWYGGSRDEICEILLNGFSLREPASSDEPYGVGTIHMAPLNCSFDGALCSAADESGLRHILLCRVILGKTELVSPDSKKVLLSSDKLDCGVDDPLNPRRYIIWSAFMNSHICPLYVVSFKAPPCLRPKFPQRMSIPKLARSLHPSKMASIFKCNKEVRGSMISTPQSTQKQRMISSSAHCLKLPRMSFPTTPKLPKFLDTSKMASIFKYDKELQTSMVSPPQSIQKPRKISFSAHCLKPTTLKLPKFLDLSKVASIVKCQSFDQKRLNHHSLYKN